MADKPRIVMFPGTGNRNENRYIDVLVGALRAEGADVRGWRPELPFQRGDVFHVHWPEVIGHIHARPGQALRGRWIARQFRAMICRVKSGGGRIVWTAHDLVPHDPRLVADPFTQHLLSDFYASVDDVLCMTEASFPMVREAQPALAAARLHLARHPHYRGVLPGAPYSLAARADMGIAPEQYGFAFLGTLRANKMPNAVASAFAQLRPKEHFLLMAGRASADMARQITAKLNGLANHHTQLASIKEKEISRLYSAADALVFPGSSYFNSGTIYTALSLNVPVIAAWSPVNEEILGHVGAQWLHLYHGELTPQVLVEAKRALTRRHQNAICDLTAFDPGLCARQHLDVYCSAR